MIIPQDYYDHSAVFGEIEDILKNTFDRGGGVPCGRQMLNWDRVAICDLWLKDSQDACLS
jgi:hypothetical protein